MIKVFLSIAVFGLSLIVIELILQMLVTPSIYSSGSLLGRELPPYHLIPKKRIDDEERSAFYSRPYTVFGTVVTAGDVMGIQREDALLGYAPKENTRSAKGWWRSNRFGARGSIGLDSCVPENVSRALLFGDSLTQGSRLPEEKTWAYRLQNAELSLETVNFGVDGYSMGQSYLRYGLVKKRLDFDFLLVMFAPTADLFRDINTMRYLNGWDSHKPNPRFVLVNGHLKLVPSPYKTLSELLLENRPIASPTLLRHLRDYDSYYIATRYEQRGALQWSVIYRLWLDALSNRSYRQIEGALFDPKGNAISVTKAIFRRWELDVRQAGRKFILAILPLKSDLKKYQTDDAFQNKWERMVDAVCRDLPICVDLLDKLKLQPSDELDTTDGTHYGPSANAIISGLLKERLSKLVKEEGAYENVRQNSCG